MQDAVEADLNAGEPRSDEAADANRDTAAEDPPKTGPNSKRAGHRGAAGIGIDSVEADACAEQAEQELKNDDENDAADDRKQVDEALGRLSTPSDGTTA